jgi:hypothetical protein
MPLEEKKYDVEANNDWAKNVKGEHLFIDNAQSGRKGYFCIGCDKQMEAVKKKNINHRSYFRHVPVDIAKDEKPCTFSNREYRETLATDILQRLKSIKVPNIFKYPPKGEDGAPMLLKKSKFVIAKKVKSQLTFYEDSNGEIKYGKNPDIEDRYLLIRPDVTFFDANDKPILLIELVITHKVNEEKKIKLRRLGIDTVSIIVPKSSEQEIEDNFKTTKRVKWEYNGIEANTEYIRVSSGTSEGILEFDEDQRRIFEESLTCRKARLNNTLRTIRKCLGAEPYRRTEHHLESEISRIESATKTEQQRLDEMEASIDQEVREELAGRFQAIESEEGSFVKQENKFQQYALGLESRYLEKIREIREEQIELNEITEKENEDHRTETEIKDQFGWDTEQLERDFIGERDKIEQDIRETTDIVSRIRREIESLPEAFKQLEVDATERFTADREKNNREQKDIDSEIENFGEYTREEERKLEIEFEEFGKQSIEKINKRDSAGDSELSKRIEAVLTAGRISRDYNERLKTYERYKSYLELVRGRAN